MGAQPRETVDVTIRISRDHADKFDHIVNALQGRGLVAVEGHKRFLIVNGAVAPDKLEELGRVAGVASVRPDRIYRAQA